MIIGCIYRHPSSNITIKHFTQDFMEHLLSKIVSEEKICAIMGDFNIDLIKNDKHDEINIFYNNLTSNFFNPFILQPTRLLSKTFIDNIFINSIEYTSFSGNLTIQLSDHLFQFTILEGFFMEILPKKINIYERNFRHFSEQEFNDSLLNTNWAE